MVRSTQCLYRDDDTVDYLQRVPASKNEIEEYLKGRQNRLFGGCESGFREVEVISAKYQDAAAWQEICIAAPSTCWQENIDFICMVKYDASESDEQEVLFALKHFIGDSHSAAYWYRLTSGGAVTEYEENPHNPRSYRDSWKSLI